MAAEDDRSVRIDTKDPAAWRRDGEGMVCPLYSGPAEQVCLRRLAAGQGASIGAAGGAELLVLDGEIADGGRRYGPGSWIRLPAGEQGNFIAGRQGVSFYLKTGHLAHPVVEG
jgi:anti-sigma factor ChrR (cupin superfamily)